MLKKIVTSALLCSALLLSGCGDNEAEDVLQTEQDIDKGNYEAIIAKYDEGVASTNEEYMALAAAYMQRAGLGLSDLMLVIADSTEDEESEAFAAFVKSTTKSSSRTALSDLSKASSYYANVVPNCSGNILSSSQEDACLYRGLVETLKAASTIGYIADDIEDFGSGGGSDAKLTSTGCAMEYALTNSFDNSKCTLSSSEKNITFQSGITYSSVDFTVDGHRFEHLLRRVDGVKNTVITNGFCTLESFDTRVEDLSGLENGTLQYHVCPITQSAQEDEMTTEALIVDSLNDGVESMRGIATDDMQNDIDEFKCEVLGGTYQSYGESGSCTINISRDVTTQDVINYLEKENN